MHSNQRAYRGPEEHPEPLAVPVHDEDGGEGGDVEGDAEEDRRIELEHLGEAGKVPGALYCGYVPLRFGPHDGFP